MDILTGKPLSIAVDQLTFFQLGEGFAFGSVHFLDWAQREPSCGLVGGSNTASLCAVINLLINITIHLSAFRSYHPGTPPEWEPCAAKEIHPEAPLPTPPGWQRLPPYLPPYLVDLRRFHPLSHLVSRDPVAPLCSTATHFSAELQPA